jgi:hypothetical protein
LQLGFCIAFLYLLPDEFNCTILGYIIAPNSGVDHDIYGFRNEPYKGRQKGTLSRSGRKSAQAAKATSNYTIKFMERFSSPSARMVVFMNTLFNRHPAMRATEGFVVL